MIKPQYFAKFVLKVCNISIKMKFNATCRKLSASDNARDRFSVGPIEPEELGLSPEISEKLRSLGAWHDTALDWSDPLAPRACQKITPWF